MPELPVLDPSLFGMPESPGVSAEPQQDLEKDHPEISQHVMAQQQDLHATNPPGTFAPSLSDGVNLEPAKPAAGLGEGMGNFMKKMATAPKVKPSPQGFIGMTGDGFPIPGEGSAGDLKPKLKMPSGSDVIEQMAGTATKIVNGEIGSGLDMAGVG